MKKQIVFLIILLLCAGFYSCLKEPQASFTVSKINAYTGEVILFTNTTADADTYEWNFGDGTLSTTTSPTHTYNSSGTYTVTLTAYSKNMKKSDIVTAQVFITTYSAVEPEANFTYSPSTLYCGSIITFTDQSTNYPSSWLWDFGDGNTSTLQNPSHTYNLAGTYTVSLTATNSVGSDTKTINLFVTNAASALAGTYDVNDVVTGTYPGTYIYTVSVTAPFSECSRLLIQNFGGYGTAVSVYCDINGTILTIPSQSPSGMFEPTTISGSGVVNSTAIVSITYTANYNSGGTDNGNCTYTKQ
ncbi:MAG: PKD domain-containing protein [Bacteroidota bacterium]